MHFGNQKEHKLKLGTKIMLWELDSHTTFILIGITVPTTEALIKMEDVSGSEMTVKVTGYQWMAI